jgi:NADH-quinone oxidoreductase subunit F
MSELILLRHKQIPGIDDLDTYRSHGGFKAFKKVVTSNSPEEVIDLVKLSVPTLCCRKC